YRAGDRGCSRGRFRDASDGCGALADCNHGGPGDHHYRLSAICPARSALCGAWHHDHAAGHLRRGSGAGLDEIGTMEATDRRSAVDTPGASLAANPLGGAWNLASQPRSTANRCTAAAYLG